MPHEARRLYAYNAGLLRDRHLRRILALAGYDVRMGLPRAQDLVGVWGRSPYARRGEAIARRRGAGLVRIEDAFLRSVLPGRAGGATLGLMIDHDGVYFDSAQPSQLETILSTAALDDPALLERARAGIARLRAADLSKYSCHDRRAAMPDPGYILVIDQSVGDAGVRYAGATAHSFKVMLDAALRENPDSQIIIKTHPESMIGLRKGYFQSTQNAGRVRVLGTLTSPWKLLDGAKKVYTVSSLMGFEAILCGHRPHVFGQPFYAGWGVTQDRAPLARRTRIVTAEQLFAAAMILAPIWYDPCRDRLCAFEDVVDQLEAEARAYDEDRSGYVAYGFRGWKRGWAGHFFGQSAPVRFAATPERAVQEAQARNTGLLVWANRAGQLVSAPRCTRVEDGFLRSRGLGAALVPPLSCVADDLGIYYDPQRESRFERLMHQPLPPGGVERAQKLREKVVQLGLSKYNLSGACPALPAGYRVLVPGQVEDDASVLTGGGEVKSNLALLRRVRAAHPEAIIIYKPHPDVEAGLRKGRVSPEDLGALADVIAHKAEPMALLAQCDAVWTISSLMGFEALLRGKQVSCLGAPFYAGWGLTHDLGPVPERRRARVGLDHLVHVALIAYPRYYDPISARACPPEVAVLRLAQDGLLKAPKVNRFWATLQTRFARFADLWRR